MPGEQRSLFWVVRLWNLWGVPASSTVALYYPPHATSDEADQAAARLRAISARRNRDADEYSPIVVVQAGTVPQAVEVAVAQVDSEPQPAAVWRNVGPRLHTPHILMNMPGSSMAPALANDTIVSIDTAARDLRRGVIVAFDPPARASYLSTMYIKRLIGLPGESIAIEDGHVRVDRRLLHEPYCLQPTECSGALCSVALAQDECYVLGDNRSNSADSRFWGPIKADAVIGTISL